MYIMSGNPIRQLTNIYGIKFKSKYKFEIKERVKLFVDRVFENVSFKDFNIVKEDIELVNFNITRLKKGFFEKHKEELLEFLNPEWYSNKKAIYIPTEKEEKFFEAVILNELIENNKDKINSILGEYLSDEILTDYFFNRNVIDNSIIEGYKAYISRHITKDCIFVRREKDVNGILNVIKEEKETAYKIFSELIIEFGLKYNKEDILEELLNKRYKNIFLDKKKFPELVKRNFVDFIYLSVLLGDL